MFLAYHIRVHHILDMIYSSVLVIVNKLCVDSCYVFHTLIDMETAMYCMRDLHASKS